MSVIIVADHTRGEISKVTTELVTAATDLEGPVTILLIADKPQELLSEVRFAGVDNVLMATVESPEFDNDIYYQIVTAVVEAHNPSVVLSAYSVNAMGYAAAVAATLDLGFASDVFGFEMSNNHLIAKRSFYGNKVEAEIEFPEKETVFLLLRAGAWVAAEKTGNPTTSDLKIDVVKSRTQHQKFVEQPQTDIDITQADFLLSIGRGIGDKENVEMFEELADKMNATLAVSRPLVDAGWVSRDRQVGQSGKTVKPKVYLALGISGAVQHLAGMSSSDTIIAVNTDPEAPIFGVANYGAHVDVLDLAEELEKIW